MSEKPKPSYFASRGVPTCSKWGKSEIEWLAFAYVTGLARLGDTWQRITPERCISTLSRQEANLFRIDAAYELGGLYADYWAMIADQLTSAEGAFDVGGLMWGRGTYKRIQASIASGGAE
jgi:hypothetical protein